MNDCEFSYMVGGKDCCVIASEVTKGLHVETTPAACKVCKTCDKPKQLNRVTVSIGLSKLREVSPEAFMARYPEVEKHLRTPETPETFRRYLLSTKEWVIGGAKERSDDEVAALLKICNACEKYRDGICTLCGCYVNDGSAWTNKLRRDNEHCPLGKW